MKNRRGVKVWRAQWRECGRGKTRILGEYSKMSRPDARAELNRILAPLNALASSVPHPTTFRKYVEFYYLPAVSWKQSTRGTTEQIIEQHILQNFGDRALASIGQSELQMHLNAKAATGLSSSVVKHIRFQLVKIYRMAQGDGLVTVNPTLGLGNPKCKRESEKKTITVDDIERAQLFMPLRERLIFRLAVCEGMRPGEIMGLQPRDYYDGMFHIERRVYRGVIDTPKGWRSERKIPATPTTAALLSQWFQIIGAPPEGWLFPSDTGKTPLSYSNIWRRRLEPLLAVAGVTANYQILRRTWKREMEKEKDATVRAQLAGHSVNVGENVYRQPQDDVLKRAMKKLDKRLQ